MRPPLGDTARALSEYRRLSIEDIPQANAIVAELAAHAVIPPAGVAWWTGELGAECSMATVARLAMVPYQIVYYGRIREQADAERVCAVLSAERDRVFTRIIDHADAKAFELLSVLELVPGHEDGETWPRLTALRAQCEAARAPIVMDLGHASPLPQRFGATARPDITCPKCAHVWAPRTAAPKRCPNPLCQAVFRYETMTPTPADTTAD